jgi:hypothetical protein
MTSENGWTNDKLFIQWFLKVFLPDAHAHRDLAHPDAPFLLIVDGHGSHETVEFLEIARAHNVIIFKLPPHTTHRLQPLDVGVFGPLQREWQKRCEYAITTTGEGIKRQDVPREYFIARSAALKPDTIVKSYKSSGIRPLGNPFISDDFAMAKATSTSACVPEGFPAERPSAHDVELLVELGLVDDIFIPEDAAQYYTLDDDSDDDHSDVVMYFVEDGVFRHCPQDFDECFGSESEYMETDSEDGESSTEMEGDSSFITNGLSEGSRYVAGVYSCR